MYRAPIEASENCRARRACLACRQLKVKCIIEQDATCQRCLRLEIPCLFRRRKNAATVPTTRHHSVLPADAQPIQRETSGADHLAEVLRRLERVETALRLTQSRVLSTSPTKSPEVLLPEERNDPSMSSLSATISLLQSKSDASSSSLAWRPSTIKALWHSFHTAMPGLHFLPEKQFFTSPIPLLFAAILYCSSSRGPPDLATFAPLYYQSLCLEIADLMMPICNGRQTSSLMADGSEEGAYQTVLGLVLASLLNEGSHKSTGLWISVAYRIMLEQRPEIKSRTSLQWQRVLSGLQILDLEHCSLYLSPPAIPLQQSFSSTHTSDQLSDLSRMMHIGLTHFAGRGVPTIWSYISQSVTRPSTQSQATLSGIDAAVIRDWARQLDDWLSRFSSGPFDSETERKATYRQYVMHRLCVLSIYLPSRHCDIFSEDITLQQRCEILDSARATLRLHADDTLIWSNWDMIMITWAGLIVLQAIKMRHAELEDFDAIRAHLTLLRQSNEPKPNLRHMLADRLDREQSAVNAALQQHIEERQERGQAEAQEVAVSTDDTGPLGYPFALFDEYSLDFVDRYF